MAEKAGYILADKGYDDFKIVDWIVKELSSKAGIPIRKIPTRGKSYSWIGAAKNFALKQKEEV